MRQMYAFRLGSYSMVMILLYQICLFDSVENRFYGIGATSPSMPCGNDSSGITTFTTTVPSMDQFISWIGFHLPVYGSLACARDRCFVYMFRRIIKYSPLVRFSIKKWNR
nr:hypothetical protein [Zea mays]